MGLWYMRRSKTHIPSGGSGKRKKGKDVGNLMSQQGVVLKL